MSSIESPIASTSQFISYPAATPSPPLSPAVPPPPAQVLKDRLYVGNLHPTVDEYVSDIHRAPLFDIQFFINLKIYTPAVVFKAWQSVET